jgi:acetyl-CoA C-acetyltransferase
VVGAGQLVQRVDDPQEGAEPLEMMIDAVGLAADDAGSRDLLGKVESVRVIRGVWSYKNPAAHIAERIGVPGAQTVGTPFGGNFVQTAVNQTALAIQRGELDVALIAGAENGYSLARARKAGVKLEQTDAPGAYDLMLGPDSPMLHDAERARGIQQPVQIYPMFENAIRYARGETLEAHRKRVSELWSRFNAVAVGNPFAWIRKPISAEEIRTPSPTNRMIGFPYPKLMNSNSSVDQAGALIVCSLEAAQRAGVTADKIVYLYSGTDAHDHYLVSNRADLHSSPAIRLAGARALELAGVGVDDLAHVDLYSCFPSAVQVAAAELGLDEERPLTVTGGLTFGGGPLNDYVIHSIATMVAVLRRDAGTRGLVTANGGFLTKHAFGVYSTEPPARSFRHADLQDEVDALPRRDVVTDHDGPATVESYTVMYGSDGPEIGHAACLTDDGVRTWANTRDPELLTAMTSEEFCGRAVTIDGAGTFAAR